MLSNQRCCTGFILAFVVHSPSLWTQRLQKAGGFLLYSVEIGHLLGGCAVLLMGQFLFLHPCFVLGFIYAMDPHPLICPDTTACTRTLCSCPLSRHISLILTIRKSVHFQAHCASQVHK